MYSRVRMIAVLAALNTISFGACRVAANNSDTYIDKQYVRYCEEIGNEYSICPEILEALIETESGGNPTATSNAGAVGLCQIIPKYSKYTEAELYQPKTSIKACAELLVDYCEEYGDMDISLVAYNCGEYSKTFKNALNTGNMTRYSNKIMKRAYVLEDIHGKH